MVGKRCQHGDLPWNCVGWTVDMETSSPGLGRGGGGGGQGRRLKGRDIFYQRYASGSKAGASGFNERVDERKHIRVASRSAGGCGQCPDGNHPEVHPDRVTSCLPANGYCFYLF